MISRYKFPLVISLLSVITACSQSQTLDLQGYVKEVKSRPYKMEETNLHMTRYQAYAYVGDSLRDPFSAGTTPGDDKVDCTPTTHSTGVLERFPLDSLSFVGNIQHSNNERWALIRSKDGTVYRLKTNDYIGQNNGRITKISADTIELDELVQQGVEGCIERHTTLTLNK